MNAKQVLAAAAALVLLSACSSAPTQPVEPDGSARVPANEPGRVQALQTRVAQDRALLTENNLLKAQVNALQQRLNEVTDIVREALLLPPKAPTPAPQAPQVAPPSVTPQGKTPKAATVGSADWTDLPKDAYSFNAHGVVIRVFHDFARTEFEPSEAVATALIAATRNAESVLVRGRTDSDTVNPIDRLIAIERAMNARSWLVNNGVSPDKITTRFSSAGQFYADNSTELGRALNRRVEIDVQLDHASAS